MAFVEPILLDDNAVVEKEFALQGRSQFGSDWIESSSTPTDMRRVIIRHSNAGASIVKGAKPIRRHLVQFVHEKFNSTLNKTEKVVVNVTLTVDPGSSFVTSDLHHLVEFARNFLTDSNTEKLIRDET